MPYSSVYLQLLEQWLKRVNIQETAGEVKD
jgi:hypothetical protein